MCMRARVYTCVRDRNTGGPALGHSFPERPYLAGPCLLHFLEGQHAAMGLSRLFLEEANNSWSKMGMIWLEAVPAGGASLHRPPCASQCPPVP